MTRVDFTQLSKTVSHVLRHEPQSYNLHLNSQGWVTLSDLVDALYHKGINVNNDTIIEMVEKSEKKRHQILDGKIRAYYGHSIKEKIIKQSSEPPLLLYHGTKQNNLKNIKEKGLLPMNRQYIHLSINEETAKIIGSRKKGETVIIKIKAKEAFDVGIIFYEENNGIWLAESICSKYLIL